MTAGTDGTPRPETPPTVAPINPTGIPPELARLPQWVAWKLEHRRGAKKPWTKVPHQPVNGFKASVTVKRGWTTMYMAAKAVQDGRADGYGFVFTGHPTARYVGIDLDGCRHPETGAIDASAAAIVARLGSYTEPSPSGTGLHIIVGVADIAAAITMLENANRTGSVEVYATGRFFTMVGDPLPGHEAINDRTDELAAWHRATFPPAAPKNPTPTPARHLADDDATIVERCRRSAKFRALYDAGDPAADYKGDHSGADLGLLNMLILAGVTDPAQLDRLHRGSALTRDKWDQRRGTATYGERTIARALDGTVTPSPAPKPHLAVLPTTTGSGDMAPTNNVSTLGGPKPHLAVFPPAPLAATGTDDAAALPDDVVALKAMIVGLTRRLEVAEHRVERAEARATAAERRADMLSTVQSKTSRIIRNNRLGQERMTAVALSYEFANLEAAGDAGDNGLHPIPLARIAEAAGVSEDAAGKHVKKLADAGVIRKVLRWEPERVDQQTGELLAPARKRQYIGPAGNVVDFVDAVAHLEPEKPKGWGGARIGCPDHPDAGTVKRWSLHCAACDRLLDRGEEARPPEPNPQDAVFVDANTDTGSTDSAEPPPPVVRHYRYRDSRVDHNVAVATGTDDPTRFDPATPIASAWLHGMEPPPSTWDRYTDGRGPA